MPLVTTNKASSANSNTPSRVVSRQEVAVSRPSASTSRAEALKQRLANTPPSQPIAPRKAGSSARQADMAKLNKYPTPANVPTNAHNTSARITPKDLNSIEPPPSGLAPNQPVETQLNNNTEPPTQVTEAPSEPLSPQFVALARKERQIRKAQQDLKAAQDAWKQEQAKYIPREQLSSDTLKVLSEAGITPDKLVELQINQATSQDPQQVLLNRIAELESKIQGIVDPENGTLAQRDKQQYESAVAQIRNDTKLLVDSNPAFGTVKSEGKTEDVVELITSVFNEEGVILDVEEAASLVEDKLVDRLYKQYERINKYEKIRSRYGKTSETSEANTVQQSPAPRVNTLTNTGATQRQLTPRERAIAKVQAALDARKQR